VIGARNDLQGLWAIRGIIQAATLRKRDHSIAVAGYHEQRATNLCDPIDRGETIS
jgi:hypothetical protein